MLDEKRQDSNLSKLILIGTYGLYTLNCTFQNSEKANGWNLKKLLSSMSKIFDESLSWRSYCKKFNSKRRLLLTISSNSLNRKGMCPKKGQTNFGKDCSNSRILEVTSKHKQRVAGNPSSSKRYQQLLENHKNEFVSLRFTMFGLVLNKLNKCLSRFQADNPLAPFLPDTLGHLLSCRYA